MGWKNMNTKTIPAAGFLEAGGAVLPPQHYSFAVDGADELRGFDAASDEHAQEWVRGSYLILRKIGDPVPEFVSVFRGEGDQAEPLGRWHMQAGHLQWEEAE